MKGASDTGINLHVWPSASFARCAKTFTRIKIHLEHNNSTKRRVIQSQHV